MNKETEELIESYYEDSIELADRKLLIFKRISNYRSTGKNAVRVLLEDLETGTSIDLALYFDAVWKFTSPMGERIFWQTAKIKNESFKELFNRFRLPVQAREIHAYRIMIKKFSNTTSNQFNKLLNIFKDV